MMTLYWSSRSPYARKAMVAAHEADLAGQIALRRMDVATLRPNDEIIGLNPLGKIPALLLEDESALYDSLVICEYFQMIAPTASLFPRDNRERLTAMRRHALGSGLMDLLVTWRAEKARPSGSRSNAHVQAYSRKFPTILDALEIDARNLAATPFSIGHIAIGCALDYADFRYPEENWRSGRPLLSQWQESFTARPSLRETRHSDEY
jgi:glutathione S-transferase